ncbi:MAG: 50S ribosomal protein L11 methyltransferase [Actinomycetota bacterium]
MAPLPETPIWQRDSSHAQVLDYHLSMLLDTHRLDAFRRAIDAAVAPGDVVVDIGCGTGILSFMACEAGARRVYAIEGAPILEVARELAVANGFDEKIEFIEGWSIDVDLPEPADVLITETIGSAGLDEGIVAWAADARARLLRPGAAVIPSRLRFWVAPVHMTDDHALITDWLDTGLPYDLGPALRRAAHSLWFTRVVPDHLLGQPEPALDVDLAAGDGDALAASGTLEVTHDGTIHGLACWFDSLLAAGITVDNSPPRTESSWGHGFMPIQEPMAVHRGQVLRWSIEISADGHHWTWEVAAASAPTADSAGTSAPPA